MLAIASTGVGVAQGFRVTGRVEHVVGADTTGLAGWQVVLHEVTVTSGRPIDSTLTDRRGRYALEAQPVDTAATYLVSVDYQGIGYFSPPLVARNLNADTASTLMVYDTSYTRPTVFTADRNTIVRSAGRDGSRRIIELFTLKNAGKLTRLAADTSTPVWQSPLPSEALRLEIGDSDVSPDAVYRRGNSVAVVAPIPPGQKQILLSYLLPRGTRDVVLPVGGYTDGMHLLLEDSAATIEGADLKFVSVDDVAGSSFYHYSGGGMEAGTVVTLHLPAPPFQPQQLLAVVVVLVGASLAAVLFFWVRRRSRTGAGVKENGASDDLAARIAALDAEFAAKGEQVSAEERTVYERERAELKRELSERLAGDPTRE